MNFFKKSKALLMLGIVTSAMLTFSGCSRTKKINLNKYVTISSEGYDSVGEAYAHFDLDKFEEDYAGKIKVTENHQSSNNGFWYDDEKQSVEEMLLNDCVEDFYFDRDTGLSNGEEITLSMDLNNTIAKEYYNVELSFDDMTFKVEDLKETKEFNPFEHVDITFSGVSPNGNMEIKPDNIPEMDYITFTALGKSGNDIANGENVKIQAKLNVSESTFAKETGKTLSETENLYSVDGLVEYLNDVSLIPDDLYNQMNQQLLDYFNSHAAQKWESDSEMADMELLGTYLLNAKPGKSLEYNNRLYFIYKVNYSNKKISNFEYIWYGEFTNITVNGDGSIDVDLNDYMYGWAKSGFFSNEGDYLDVEDTGYYVAGFKTIEDFENTYIITKLEDYTYTQNVR